MMTLWYGPRYTAALSPLVKIAIYLVLLSILDPVAPSRAQSFTPDTLNGIPIYAHGSLVQDYDADGDLDFVVTRRARLTLSPGVEWFENDGSAHFTRHLLFEDLVYPVDIKAADFDGDGDLDYVVADKGTGSEAGQLAWFQRGNDGSYIKWTLAAGESFDEVAVADFDGDGRTDIVAVGFNLTTIDLYTNEGDLTFTRSAVDSMVTQVTLVEADDIDDDGDVDILYEGRLLRNTGDGTFSDRQNLFTLPETSPSMAGDIAVADLNGDGVKDILSFAGRMQGGFYWLDGADNFAPSFIERIEIDTGGSILVTDLDGNGRADIIRQHIFQEKVYVLYQDAPSTFRSVVLEDNWDNVSLSPPHMALGDFDGDGDEDVLFPEGGNVDGDLSWFENIDGVLYRHYIVHELKAPRMTKLGDLDGDGDLDIVLTAGDDAPSDAFRENEIVWYENRGDGIFVEWRIDDAIAFPFDVELADLDGDGALDVVASGQEENALYRYTRDGPGWARMPIESNGNRPSGIAVADLDADGDADVLSASYGDDKVFWYQNDGAGAFVREVFDAALSNPLEVDTVDIDGDDDLDVVVVTGDVAHTVAVYVNEGAGTFTRALPVTGWRAVDVETGDWTGDGIGDVIVGIDGDSEGDAADEPPDLMLIATDGAGGFTATPLSAEGWRVQSIELADVDQDGDLDLWVAQADRNPSLYLLYNADGAVDVVVSFQEVNYFDYQGLSAGYVNDDDVIDLVAAATDIESLVLFSGGEGGPISTEPVRVPGRFVLDQNVPNPFRSDTRIRFVLDEPAAVTLVVYDVLGREVRRLVDGVLPAGPRDVVFASDGLPSGTYLYRLQADGYAEARAMVLVR